MLGLLQRVTQASVTVEGRRVAALGRGLLVLVGVEREDSEPQAGRLVERLLGYRVFPDEQGRMNLSLSDIGGGLLLVPQFTLAANTRKGTRPGFSTEPEPAQQLADRKVQHVLATGAEVLVTSNPGCLLQISNGLKRVGRPMPAVHPVELIDASIRGVDAATILKR